MAAAVARGAQTVNSMYIKPMLRKAYHKKGNNSGDMISDAFKMNGEEAKSKSFVGGDGGGEWWVPDHRTGIYYLKGHEKVIEDVPLAAGKDLRAINWFSNHEDFI